MFLSRDSGMCQFCLRCHWMGLMCNLPNGTCFSVAVRRPMRDMNCLTEQDCLSRRKWILSFKICISEEWEGLLLGSGCTGNPQSRRPVLGPIRTCADSRPNLVPDKGSEGPVSGKSRTLWSDSGLASRLGTGVTGFPLPEPWALLLDHNGELHRSSGEAEWQGSKLQSLTFQMEP